jgi:hypothetical protein
VGASETLQTILERNSIGSIDAFLVDCEGADWIVFEQLDLKRYRPSQIKVEIGALAALDIGNVVVKLKTAGYRVSLDAEDVWGVQLARRFPSPLAFRACPAHLPLAALFCSIASPLRVILSAFLSHVSHL